MPPFLGLILSSAAFLVPAAVARRRRKRRMALACRGLAATSVAYHSCYGRLVTVVDTVYAHAFAVTFALCAVAHAKQTPCRRRRLVPSIMILPFAIYFRGVKRTDGRASQLWHVAFHLASQACLVVYGLLF